MNPEVVTYLETIGIDNDSTVYNAGTSREATGAQLYAIHNKLWDDLDSAGVLSKLKFMHLLYWGDGDKNKLNFLNPVDTDAAFRLEFFGGWTFDEEGSQPNGTNGYANTHYNPSAETGGVLNEHLGVYSLTDNEPLDTAACDLGSWTSSSRRTKISLNRGVNKSTAWYRTSNDISNVTSADGYFLGTTRNTGTNHGERNLFLKDGTNLGNSDNTDNAPNQKVYFGAENFGVSAPFSSSYTNQKYLLIHGGEGLTDQEAEDLSEAISDFYFLLENAEEAPEITTPASITSIVVEGELQKDEIFFDEVSFTSLFVEGELDQDERFDEPVSFTSLFVEGETQRPKFKGAAFETAQEKPSFQGVAFEIKESGGYTQIIMLQK